MCNTGTRAGLYANTVFTRCIAIVKYAVIFFFFCVDYSSFVIEVRGVFLVYISLLVFALWLCTVWKDLLMRCFRYVAVTMFYQVRSNR